MRSAGAKLTAIALWLAGTLIATPALAQTCGGDFGQWLEGVRREAAAEGIGPAGLAALNGVRPDARTLKRDRAQGVFAQDFLQFSDRMVSKARLQQGPQLMRKYASVFGQVERRTGVPAPVITAYWALETDFGANLGDFSTLNSLATLAHDCRRPELFRPHLIDALRIVDRGDLRPEQMVGAWAGELGHTQILPSDYIEKGVDEDGDGRVDLMRSVPDVIATTSEVLADLGWRAGEPWLQEVRVPADFAWERAGLDVKLPRATWASLGVAPADGGRLPADQLPASLLLPMGRNGPAFLAYPNFDVYLQWNKSLVYSTSAAYLATRLAGAPAVRRGTAKALDIEQVKRLQQILQRQGYDVGKVDGILGAGTRAAVRDVQKKLGLPADAWPDAALLARLGG